MLIFELKPESYIVELFGRLWARMVYGFTDSTEQLVETSQDFVVSIVAILPFLLVLGVNIFGGIPIRKKLKAWQVKIK